MIAVPLAAINQGGEGSTTATRDRQGRQVSAPGIRSPPDQGARRAVAIVAALLGLEVPVDRARDRLDRAAGLVLVHHRRPFAVVARCIDRNRVHSEAAYHRDGAHGYCGYRKESRE
jgi:hypothetical protein